MFFYKESAEVEAPVMGLSYSVSPSSLSFIQNGQVLTFDVSVTGTGADNYTVSSTNPNFSVSPTSGGVSGGDTVTVSVTFNGNDNTQIGTITFNGDNYGSVTVNVDSSGYSSGGIVGGSGPPGGTGDGGLGGGGSPPPP
jgi:hypothetical protein